MAMGAGMMGQWLRRQAQAHWARLAANAAPPDAADLAEARALRADLERLLRRAEAQQLRATRPLPLGCDWAWRPDPWLRRMQPPGLAEPAAGAALAPGVRVFHDAGRAECTVRQLPGPDIGLALEAYGFDGGFLSLSFDLPPEAVAGLGHTHVLVVQLALEAERPAQLFCRLNLRHGPNTEQMLRSVAPDTQRAEFDLAYAAFNDRRLEQGWLDVIVEAPRMTAVVLRDMVLLRHPRADI